MSLLWVKRQMSKVKREIKIKDKSKKKKDKSKKRKGMSRINTRIKKVFRLMRVLV